MKPVQLNQRANLIFSKFVKNFSSKNDSENTLSLSLQNVSNNKYLKLYKLNQT